MTNWTQTSIQNLYETPFMDLLMQAQTVHRQHFQPNEVETCTLLNIKTGACPEDCAYCPQSGHYKTGIEKEKLFDFDTVMQYAEAAKANGSTRFCMGAAWKYPPKKDFPKVLKMITAVKALGLETCVTLGQLDDEQVKQLKAAGLDYYNHNLDTSPEYYKEIITTRTYQDRIDTLKKVGENDINVCCGGIIGMGEKHHDRVELLYQLSQLPTTPKSIPINRLMAIQNTPLAHIGPIDNFEFIRTIAVTRIMFPQTNVRLSAGRENMSEEMQALCFMAGANSIFVGDKLLTAKNPELEKDQQLFGKLGLTSRSENHATVN
ncbi:MAG: biotin synthase BioB [Coxiellaceae bacterium]|nr:biotin synthase BioB [Coxiellaceae bacterium]